jgi:hypothetical protein
MNVEEAQREMRTVFLGGSVGQAVSGAIWLVSALLGALVSVRYGLIALFLGGCFIFPLTQLVIKLSGRPASLKSGNPLEGLARQVAFIVPLCLPVIAAAALYKVNWFYPAFMVVVGAHYLPFAFLYGMRQYTVLGAVLIAGGVAFGMLLPQTFAPAGFFTGAILVLFALWVGFTSRR